MSLIENTQRRSASERWMQMARLVAEDSTCLRRKVGAIAVKDNRVIATGFNGAPVECTHCEKVGCLREQLGVPSGHRAELCRAVHAEQNVVAQAALFGISLKGATIFQTTQPCLICLKLLINSGIEEIIYEHEYADEMVETFMKDAGVKIKLTKWKP